MAIRSQIQIKSTFGGVDHTGWQDGDIAFLQHYTKFSEEDYTSLIPTRRLPRGATGHPCIVLQHLSGADVLITTVSAYGSGAHNGYLAPWKRSVHARINPTDFRSFQGSERPTLRCNPLTLESGKLMPKPKASWLNINSTWKVPITALSHFDKSRDVLRLTQQSLTDLRLHIVACSKRYDAAWTISHIPSASIITTQPNKSVAVQHPSPPRAPHNLTSGHLTTATPAARLRMSYAEAAA